MFFSISFGEDTRVQVEDEWDYDESQQNKGGFKFDDVYGGGNKRTALLDQDETKRRSD